MISQKNLSGHQVIVQDIEQKKVYARTTIYSYNSDERVLTLSRSAFQEDLPKQVVVLIFYDYALYEYAGSVRRSAMATSFIDIAIYSGKEKEDRSGIRHEINFPGVIDALLIAGKPKKLSNPIAVTVVNLSTGGCLLRGKPSLLNINTTFNLLLDQGESALALHVTVVRIVHIDAETAEYGCSFN